MKDASPETKNDIVFFLVNICARKFIFSFTNRMFDNELNTV